MADDVCEEEIQSWLEKVVTNEQIKEYTFDIESTKSSGYMGNVVFVKVKGVTSSGEVKNLDLVVKFGKKSKEVREKLMWAEYYARELFFYSTVVPSFQIFQTNRKKQDFFNNIPKCYATLFVDNIEVIVLEDLRLKGYKIHDKFTVMNEEHIEIILDTMARFHAISFCYQHQNKEEFDLIFGNYGSMNDLEMRNLEDVMLKLKSNIYSALRKTDLQLAEEFKQKFKDDMCGVFRRILEAEVKEKVITHCDCWNNNYLFKYENEDKMCPSDVVVLDWQLSNLHSPVFDLAEIIYALTAESLSKYTIYLKFYHNQLSKYITELGSNPEELFPFSTLMDHWKKYSCYGLMKILAFLDLMVCDEVDAVSYNNMDAEDFVKHMRPSNKKKFNDLYYVRLACIIKHYCNEN